MGPSNSTWTNSTAASARRISWISSGELAVVTGSSRSMVFRNAGPSRLDGWKSRPASGCQSYSRSGAIWVLSA